MPVMANNIVATSQPLASQAGLRMLLRGGNAVDAAIATAITLTVVEPTSNGLGSDSFALVWDAEERKLHGLNASGRSPAAWNYDHFAQYQDGGGEGKQGEGGGGGTMPILGWDTVTVPGAVSAWVELSERYGKLPFKELFQPAIHYARDGFPVSPITARVWPLAEQKYQGMPDFGRVFLPWGKSPVPGQLFRNPHQATSLELIAATAGEAFYNGELAERIIAHSQDGGGLMTREDLASHAPEWVEPISVDYHGHTLHEIPPNGQGIAALEMLGILENREDEISEYPVDSAESLHLQIEAMKLAFADTHRYVSDRKWMEIDPEHLLDAGYLAERGDLIDIQQAQDPGYGLPGHGGTVYLTTADENGMMLSYIQSNYMGFGSGIVVPGTGIALQNRGRGFNLEKGHPNQVDGGKRPFHTIIPAFVTREGVEGETGGRGGAGDARRGGGGEVMSGGKGRTGQGIGSGTGEREPVMSFGVMGGPMQPQGHAQMMIRMFDYHQNPQTAIDAPRWQVFPDLEVAVEPGISDQVIIDLIRRGHRITRWREFWWFGGAQAIYCLGMGKGRYCSGSDPRKDGQAFGF